MSQEQDNHNVLANRILHILDCFPKISPSMVQISLGSGVPTSMWRPVLDKLVEDGEVYRYQKTVVTPAGRSQVITVISSQPDDDPEG